MRPITAFGHMFSTTVQVAARTGQDESANPTYDPHPVTYRAHIGRASRLVLDAMGQQVVSSRRVWLMTNAAVQPTAQVTLTTGDAGSTEEAVRHPVILSVERLSDGRGPHHTVLNLK